MSAWESVTRADIERLRYLNNPRTAAAYLRVPQAMIEDVWAEMPERDPIPMARMDDKHQGTGLRAHLIAEADARSGSLLLRDSLKAYFRKWEKTNGFIEGAGEILVPAGWDDERNQDQVRTAA